MEAQKEMPAKLADGIVALLEKEDADVFALSAALAEVAVRLANKWGGGYPDVVKVLQGGMELRSACSRVAYYSSSYEESKHGKDGTDDAADGSRPSKTLLEHFFSNLVTKIFPSRH